MIEIIQEKQIYLKKGFREENYAKILEWFRDLEVVGYLYSAKRIIEFRTVWDVKNFLAEEEDEIFWEIYAKDGEFIGYGSLCDFKNGKQCEFSIFLLNKKYWGKGIGFEASKIILNYAFSKLRMKKVVLETSEFHNGAIKLYEKLGFRKIKTISNDRTVFHDGEWILSGSVIMEMEKE